MGSNDRELRKIETDLSKLSSASGLNVDELLAILKQRESDRQQKTIPLSIFSNRAVSSLEAIVKYLKEEALLNYKEIAVLLNRNYAPIAITYRNSLKKLPGKLDLSSDQRLPLSIFVEPNSIKQDLSVLETIVIYLKSELKLTLHEIAVIMRRDDRTIWTAYHRAEVKSR